MRANLQQKGRPTEADAWNYRLWLLYITAGCRRLGIRLRGGHTFDRAEAAEAQNKKHRLPLFRTLFGSNKILVRGSRLSES